MPSPQSRGSTRCCRAWSSLVPRGVPALCVWGTQRSPPHSAPLGAANLAQWGWGLLIPRAAGMGWLWSLLTPLPSLLHPACSCFGADLWILGLFFRISPLGQSLLQTLLGWRARDPRGNRSQEPLLLSGALRAALALLGFETIGAARAACSHPGGFSLPQQLPRSPGPPLRGAVLPEDRFACGEKTADGGEE